MSAVGIISRHRGTADHLGVWAYDREADVSWGTGRYVPLCGQERDHALRWHLTEWPAGRGDGVKRKPLCTRCRALLDDLAELASRRTPPDTP